MSPRRLNLIEFLTILGIIAVWVGIIQIKDSLGMPKETFDYVCCLAIMCLSGMFGKRAVILFSV